MHRLLSIAQAAFLCLAGWTVFVSDYKLLNTILFLVPYVFFIHNVLSHRDESELQRNPGIHIFMHRTPLGVKVTRSSETLGFWCACTIRTLLLPMFISGHSPFILLQILSLYLTSYIFYSNFQIASFALVNVVSMMVFLVQSSEVPLSMNFVTQFIAPIWLAVSLIIGQSMLMKEFYQKLLAQYRNSESSNSRKSVLLSTIAHEIRTPLNSMLGCADILNIKCSEMNAPKECKEIIETMHVAGVVLLETLNSILDYVKYELSDSQRENQDSFLKTREFDLNCVVKDVLSIAKVQARIKKITLDIRWKELDPNCCIICNTDPVRLKQVLLNLLSNAVKFTFEGGVLLSITRTGQNNIQFQITDTGVGIPDEFVPRLFSPFMRGPDQKRDISHGTGLGLAISKQIVDLMHGSIRYSVNKTRGSTFSVVLPIFVRLSLAPNPCDSSVTDDDEVIGHKRSKLRALLVDDNLVNLKVMDVMLNSLHIDHICVSSGEEALQVAKNYEFQLILTDIGMCGISGIDLVKILRREFEKTGKTNVLFYFISGSDEEDLSKEVLHLVDGFCRKPLRLSKLQEIVKHSETKLAEPTEV